jgi:lysophospholipase L1-like esterase
VGASGSSNSGFAAIFDGTSWRHPVVIGKDLGAAGGVSCPSASFCLAVGNRSSYNTTTNKLLVTGSYAATYDAGAWSAPVILDDTGAVDIQSVSCATRSFCVAVGASGYVLTYADGVWGQPQHFAGEPLAVSCPTRLLCMAAGSDNPVNPTRGVVWALGLGSLRSQRSFASTPQLVSISCPGASFCLASDINGNVFAYDGRSWHGPARVDPSGRLNDMSCASAKFCAAVSASGHAFLDVNGSWSRAMNVDPRQQLYSVSCPSSSFCMAVDNQGHAVEYRTRPAVTPKPGYVALGDSYSSGEANPPFMQPNTGCDRSASGAWPELMARTVRLRVQALLACSGATTMALTSSFKRMPPQLLSLSRIAPAPKLVTITMGGNDLGFADVLTNCYLATCSTLLAGVEGSFAGGFGKHMTAVYGAIRRTVPHARIVVVGYPQMMPRSPITALRHCLWLKDPADPALMRKVTGQLDGILSRAAKAAGVSYVSTLNALKGHELCTAHAWLKAIGPSGGNSRGHPTALGQAALAAVVARYVTKHHLAP